MIRLRIFSLFAVLGLSPLPAQDVSVPEATPDPRIEQRDQMVEKSLVYVKEGKLSDAVATRQQVVALEKQIFGDTHAELANDLEFIAGREVELGHFDVATQTAKELITLREAVSGKDHEDTIDARWMLDWIERVAKAESALRQRICDSNALFSRLSLTDDYTAALESAQAATNFEKLVLPTDHPGLANGWYNQATCAANLGHYGEAVVFITKALPGYRSGFGQYSKKLEERLRELSILHFRLAQHEESFRYAKGALEIAEKRSGDSSQDYLTALSYYAQICYETQRPEAESVFRQLVELSSTLHGDDSAAYADNLNTFGLFLDDLSKYTEAETTHRKAVEIRKAVLGTDHRDYGTSLNNLAATLENQRKFVEAVPLYQQSLQVKERSGDKDSESYLTTLLNLARTYALMERFDDAETAYRQAVGLSEHVHGNDSVPHADNLNTFGNFLGDRGKYTEAETTHRRALEIRKAVLGTDHRDYGTSLNNLAWTLEKQRKFVEAAPLYLQSLQVDERNGDRDSESSLTKLSNLARTYALMERFDEAEVAYRQTDELSNRLHGDDSTDYADNLNTLGLFLDAQGKYSEAETIHRKAVEIRKAVLGTDHLLYGVSLHNLASTLESQRHFVEAESLYRQSLQVKERSGDKHSESYLITKASLARTYRLMLRFDESDRLYQEIVDSTAKSYGGESEEFATAIHNFGVSCRESGRFAQARGHFEKALQIRTVALGRQSTPVATTLYQLGMTLDELAEYESAISRLEECAAIRKVVLGSDSLDYSEANSLLGLVYSRAGHPEMSLPLVQKDLELTRAKKGEECSDYAWCEQRLGYVHWHLGDFQTAEFHMRRSLQIFEKLFGVEGSPLCTALNNVAFQCMEQGRYIEAITLYVRCLNIRRKAQGAKHPDVGQALDNLGRVCEHLGDDQRAMEFYRQGLAVRTESLGRNHVAYAGSLQSVADLLVKSGDLVSAEEMLEEARGVVVEAVTKRSKQYAGVMGSLADLAHQKGYDLQAAEYLQEALDVRRTVHGEKHPYVAGNLHMLAVSQRRLGNFTEAIDLYRDALTLKAEVLGEMHPSYANTLTALGRALTDNGQAQDAVPHFQRALRIITGHIDQSSFALSERQQIALNQMQRWHLDEYLRCCLSMEQPPVEAVQHIVTWKGNVLMRQRAIRLAADDPAISEQFTELQRKARQLAALTRTAPEPEKQAGWKELVASVTTEKEKLESALMQSSAAFRDAMKTVTYEQVREAIPDDAVLIDYLEYNNDETRCLLASIIRRTGDSVLIDLGPVADISTAIDAWRETFGMSPQGMAAGTTLRKKVWEPLVEHIGEAKTILVSTDGVLGRLPLSALPGREPGRYLLEDHRLALVPVPQLLPALVNRQGRKALAHELLLLGDVDYDVDPEASSTKPDEADSDDRPKRPWERRALPEDLRGNVHWKRLPATGDEVRFIRELYEKTFRPEPDAIIDLRSQHATEAAFREHAGQSMFLHIATHGFFAAADKPSALSAELVVKRGEVESAAFGERREVVRGFSPGQLSGLVFAGANHPPMIQSASEDSTIDDGIMTADEIAFLPLGGVELAVLSACETGLGEVAGGEGLLGLQRSFQIAGTRSTLATLWNVSDNATRRMMQEFYTNYLQREMSILDAMREAQLWALNNPAEIPRGASVNEETTDDPERLSPYFWAPFVLSGDWR